jgi:protein-arginine kinase
MLRDRLRVLEQNINSNNKLSDKEKVHIQQYITRSYGSLTTFNIFFAEKEHYFVGAKTK